MTRVARAIPVLTLALVAMSACRRQQPETQPVPDTTPTMPAVDSAAIRDSIARAQAEERRRAEEAAAAERARRLEAARTTLAAPVYFDYDSAELLPDARTTLDAKVPLLTANAGIRVRVGGHTDNRGSDEYNVALGQRRAASVKRYLETRGIDGARIDVVSYGEERPAVNQENEGAWAQNRRAEFEIVAGELTNVGG